MTDSLFGPDPVDELVELIQAAPGWPADDVKDRQLVTMLVKQYPHLDLAEEITKWSAWMLDHRQKKEVRHRARFTRWCSNATGFRRASHAAGRGGSRGSRSGGAPRPAEAFTGRGGEGGW